VATPAGVRLLESQEFATVCWSTVMTSKLALATVLPTPLTNSRIILLLQVCYIFDKLSQHITYTHC